jgi:putative glutamine amidotransferase
MPRPLIAITVDSADKPGKYALNTDYPSAIEAAGGLPFPIPYKNSHALIPEFLDLVAGVLLTGGDDMDPARFGQTRHPQAIPIDPAREAFEFALIAEIERRRLPALGICFGAQLMNVHRGGDLHQFLPDLSRDHPVEHRKIGGHALRHPVLVDSHSRLGQAIGKGELSVNTFHKQAINHIGRGLRVVATAPDGVVEAIEDPALPLFSAVQWHPERLTDEPEHLAIFQMLVRAAADAGTVAAVHAPAATHCESR